MIVVTFSLVRELKKTERGKYCSSLSFRTKNNIILSTVTSLYPNLTAVICFITRLILLLPNKIRLMHSAECFACKEDCDMLHSLSLSLSLSL